MNAVSFVLSERSLQKCSNDAWKVPQLGKTGLKRQVDTQEQEYGENSVPPEKIIHRDENRAKIERHTSSLLSFCIVEILYEFNNIDARKII